jgi:hypothetical protein
LDQLGEVETDPRGDPFFWLAGNFAGGPHGHVDFSEILHFEEWPKASAPKGLLYFSGVLGPAAEAGVFGTRAEEDARVKHECVAMLKTSGAALFQGWATAPGSMFSFDFGLLHDTSAAVGITRFNAQYWRANALPSERYTASPPDTKGTRIDPRDSGLKNLTIAGDWADFGLNVGSFEGACMAGMLAASAIEPSLPVNRIIGFAPTIGDQDER